MIEAGLGALGRNGATPDPAARLAGRPLVERELRAGLEQSYRDLARMASTAEERIRLVDEANRVRPRTWT
jgi:serine/threonine-protein kinase PknG